MNCNGCGVELDPSQDQVNLAVDQVLEASLTDAIKKGGVCPLCGHSKEVPYSRRSSVQFLLLVTALIAATALGVTVYRARQTRRLGVANQVLLQLNQNPTLVQVLGQPLAMGEGLEGDVRKDETGWTETHLTMPVRGPRGGATILVRGGRGTGPWTFTTLEAIVAAQHKKIDLITGRIVDYGPATYVDVHTQAAVVPQYGAMNPAGPRMPGDFPCVFGSLERGSGNLQLGDCGIMIPMLGSTPVDQYQVDLRYGSFLLKETDLLLADTINIPFTRVYNSSDWVHPNRVHAFGRNANHTFDIAPLGSRNPYTYQLIVLADGNWLYFDRISEGTGYGDAVFQHTETSTSFYGATTKWNGHGWTTQLKDGSTISFPESYNATNMAQGAASEMTDTKGDKLELVRDGKRDLQTVRAPRGGAIHFVYDDQSRITRVEDTQGHWANYQYNSRGVLTDVVLSSGKERHFTYSGDLLTSIRDETGHVVLQNFYGNLLSSNMLDHQRTDAGTYSYQYDLAPSRTFATRAVVTFPDGSTKTIETINAVPDYVKNMK